MIPNYVYTPTASITAEDVYGKGRLPSIPEGFEFVEFRPPKDGELYLATAEIKGRVCVAHPNVVLDDDSPRVIVRHKPQPRRWVVEEISAEEWNSLCRRDTSHGYIWFVDARCYVTVKLIEGV